MVFSDPNRKRGFWRRETLTNPKRSLFIAGLAVLFLILTATIPPKIHVMAAETIHPVHSVAAIQQDSTTATPLQGIIHAQLQAIQKRDSAGAWALLTPDYRKRMGTHGRFLETIRHDYWPVYTHRNAAFLDLHTVGTAKLQTVRMTDRYGLPVLVIFRLEPQGNDTWLIDSIVVLEPEGQPI